MLFDKLHVEMQDIRVLILSDDPIIRAGLSTILAEDDSLNVVGQTGIEHLNEALIDAFLPDVLLLESDELSTMLRRKLLSLNTPLIVISEESGESPGKRDVVNYIPRDTELPVMSAALHAAAVGLGVYKPLEQQYAPFELEYDEPFEALTTREREVIQLIAQGLTNRAIGQALAIKESTVKFHVNGILEKLGAQSRTEATMVASRIGLITL